MLNRYEAISFQGIITGGKTQPWLVLANVNGNAKPYIIKLFNQEMDYEGESVGREVMGNMLARQFNLDVPEFALIDICSVLFEQSIYNRKALDRFKSLKVKFAFGTEYLYPNLCFFYDILKSGPIKHNINFASIFAFDIMIRNTDRNFKRPNLLIHSNLAYLIDFESSFQLRKDPLEDVLVRTKTHTYYYMHVFHSLLSSCDAEKKETIFDEFINRLEAADFISLHAYIDELKNTGYVIHQHNHVINYLEAIKENRFLFSDALKSLIHE
ncbi:MAG: HipA family kinase [Bacteroidota bacterium]